MSGSNIRLSLAWGSSENLRRSERIRRSCARRVGGFRSEKSLIGIPYSRHSFAVDALHYRKAVGALAFARSARLKPPQALTATKLLGGIYEVDSRDQCERMV